MPSESDTVVAVDETGPPEFEGKSTFQIALELSMTGMDEDASSAKKAQNTTECVPVPSSEHVAEIVGRQGCKIKALRTKTNTYIKTPVRGEEPVFVVTGRKEDVLQAKREITSAAEHFSQIRASRRSGSVSSASSSLSNATPSSPSASCQVTIQVRVPYRVVGLVVGPKGATIKRIQQDSSTYIVTPNRDKEPIFEVTGLPENVEIARAEIEGHIANRIGGMPADVTDFRNNGIDTGFHGIDAQSENQFYTISTAQSAFTMCNISNNVASQEFPFHVAKSMANSVNGNEASPGIIDPSTSTWSEMNGGAMYSISTDYICNPGTGSPPVPLAYTSNSHVQLARMRSDPLSGGLSAMLNPPPLVTAAFTPFVPTMRDCFSISPGESCSASNGDCISSSSVECFSASSGESLASRNVSVSSSPVTEPQSCGQRPGCLVCGDSDIVAVLVPCGHNAFCMECANLIVEKADDKRKCPVCQEEVSQAIRIIN